MSAHHTEGFARRPRSTVSLARLTSTLALALGIFGVACTKTKPAAETDKAHAASTPAAAAATETEVNLFIWAEYTSKPMLEEFTKKTGIKVNESNYSSNEELLAKLQAGATGFDLAVPSDYMVSVMAKLALVQELDKSQIPNAANLDPKFLGKSYDPGNKVSLPYGWAITGFAVNRTLYDGPAASWGDLLQNDRVKGRVSLLDDVREALATALKLQGSSLNTQNPDELARAKALLAASKKNIKAFNSTPADLLTAGEVLIAQMYSTEALVAARDSGKKIEFVIPKEGATVAIDNVVLLKGAPHPRAAYALMNFFYEKAVNADLVTRMFAGPVVAGVRDVLPPEVRDNKSLFPSEEELARCEMMEDLGAFTSQYDRAWSEIKAASH